MTRRNYSDHYDPPRAVSDDKPSRAEAARDEHLTNTGPGPLTDALAAWGGTWDGRARE